MDIRMPKHGLGSIRLHYGPDTGSCKHGTTLGFQNYFTSFANVNFKMTVVHGVKGCIVVHQEQVGTGVQSRCEG